MGSATSYICRTCGTHFMARDGGGFMFDLLHCDTCGATKSVSHEELGDIHLGFVKGLPGPYAMARAAMDRRIQAEYPGRTLTQGRVPRGDRGYAPGLCLWRPLHLQRARPLPRVPVHQSPVGPRSPWPDDVH